MKANIYILTLVALFTLQSFAVKAQSIQYERSYVNITKGTPGGTIEPGDVLELRATIVVANPTAITRCTFADVIPTGTSYVLGSIKIQSNEGVVVQSLTDAASDDAGTRAGANITVNVGTSATAALGGNITGGTTTPKFSTTSIIVVAYRVTVTAAYNNDITFQGTFAYRVGSATISTFNFTPITLRTYTNLQACVDSRGSSAVIDNNGTFGSGTTQNRASSPAIPAGYTYQPLTASQPNDGYYSIINNTSPTGATNPSSPKPGSDRVFSVFDILGDHTGAASATLGNPPAAPGTNGGYMVLINASYRTDAAINQTVSNLCPNTYYDFSAWFRNICSLCGADVNSVGTNTPGVKPNLSFLVNGKAYYTSGEIPYTNNWVRKGFVYRTGPSETSVVITIRNNAPGGGGNDWVMDDVSFSICLPRVQFTAFPYYVVCQNNQVDINATVRSIYNNYTEYVWEKSTDNGASWINTGIGGSGTPMFVSGQYEYTVNYPSFIGTPADSGTQYRIRIATSAGNLTNPNCSYVDVTQISVVQVKNCGVILPVNLYSFAASDYNNERLIKWTIVSENGKMVTYTVEKSADGVNFTSLGSLPGIGENGSGYNHYQWIDETVNPVEDAYYRLRISADDVNGAYSQVSFIKGTASRFSLQKVENPFHNSISFRCISPASATISVHVTDMTGVIRKAEQFSVTPGINNLLMNDVNDLPAGTYLLQVKTGLQWVQEKIIKYYK